jgi:cupin fold WbuC family metalloprotein
MIQLNQELFDKMALEAKNSERRRKNLNFHTQASDTLQRMIHSMEPDTYVQPHRHINPDKREVFIAFRGKVAAIEYNDDGTVARWCLLEATGATPGVEMTPRAWHSLIALESSIIYEVKDGPYDPADDKYFADWAPGEASGKGFEFNDIVLKYIGLR